MNPSSSSSSSKQLRGNCYLHSYLTALLILLQFDPTSWTVRLLRWSLAGQLFVPVLVLLSLKWKLVFPAALLAVALSTVLQPVIWISYSSSSSSTTIDATSVLIDYLLIAVLSTAQVCLSIWICVCRFRAPAAAILLPPAFSAWQANTVLLYCTSLAISLLAGAPGANLMLFLSSGLPVVLLDYSKERRLCITLAVATALFELVFAVILLASSVNDTPILFLLSVGVRLFLTGVFFF